MKVPSFVNQAICESIPIDKDLKRYLINRFGALVDSNGRKYASDVFKNMSEVCLRYRADPSRLENLDIYLRAFPLKYKGWVRKIFHYMDCQPMMMLDFLKLYCGMTDPLVTVSESATAQQEYLESRPEVVNPQVPGILRKFLDFVLSPPWAWDIGKITLFAMMCPDEPLSRLVNSHSPQVALAYRDKWNRILTRFPRISDSEATSAMQRERIPVPEVYKDFNQDTHLSQQMEEDYWAFCHLLQKRVEWPYQPPLSDRSIGFLKAQSSNHPDAFNLWDETSGGRGRPWLPESGGSDLYCACVGQVHHIPKKGTIKRRPIAVPNRFLQMGLLPMQMQLDAIVRRLPRDCTFDQSRYDVKILNRVTNPNLYVGSVDLSQATDNLPSNWGWYIWDRIALTGEKAHRPLSNVVKDSAFLFREVSSGPWMNGDYQVFWDIGQPLGSLPSFDFLALTHNLLLESLSFSRGLSHSPYAVLGDDVLIMNKNLRRDYITLMSAVGVPLSLQKSYEGNLVEFAGKIFIRNQVPKYRSDHNPITYNSLFDYQRSTGVEVKWDKLPKGIRRRFESCVVASGLPASDGMRVYSVIQRNLVTADLRPNILLKDIDVNSVFWIELTDSDDQVIPDPILQSGVVMLSSHPVTFGDYGYAEKHGHLQRYRQITLPRWYKEKFRPFTTERLIQAAVTALKSVMIA